MFWIVVGFIFWLRQLLLASKNGDENVLYRIYTVYACMLIAVVGMSLQYIIDSRKINSNNNK